jgi:hypothetical protein
MKLAGLQALAREYGPEIIEEHSHLGGAVLALARRLARSSLIRIQTNKAPQEKPAGPRVRRINLGHETNSPQLRGFQRARRPEGSQGHTPHRRGRSPTRDGKPLSRVASAMTRLPSGALWQVPGRVFSAPPRGTWQRCHQSKSPGVTSGAPSDRPPGRERP